MERQQAIDEGVAMSSGVVIIPNNSLSYESTIIWDRLPDETPDEFTRFECYRQAVEGGRSIGKAYRAYILLRYGQEEYDRRKAGSKYALTSYPKNWADMAKRNHWAERAAAFDAHQHDLDMQIETAERDRCRQLRKTALHDLLTASTNALAQIDLSEANLAQASTAIKTAVRELRIEYHDDASTQVEINAMLAIIPNELRQGILAMLQAKVTTSGPPALPDNIIDNDET